MGNVNFKLPKKEYDKVVVVNTPLATDAVLAYGKLQLLDENAALGLELRLSDVLKGGKVAYSAGAAHKLRVALASISLTANTEYRLTIVIPNRVDFFGGGKETNPLNTIRTYSWASGAAAPTAAAVRDAFIAVINADLYAGVVASANSTANLDILAASADAGQLQVSFSDSSATYSDVTAYVAPVGTTSEVELQAPGLSSAGITYNRYEFVHRRIVRNNTVSGLQVIKPVKSVVYAASGSTAYETILDNYLAGTISVANLAAVGTEVAKYFAVPAL
jgi:hypothetical protein